MAAAARRGAFVAQMAVVLCGACGICAAQVGSSAAATKAVARKGARGTPPAELSEVVVTAQKRAQNAQSVPESVQAIGAHELTAAHVTKLDDLGSLVSNLNIVTRADNTPDVVMRGVGSFGVVQGVGFYADGVQLFDGQTVRPEDLERIEVLKGPQGTLYGGSNIGGAIKYETKLPTDDFNAQASVEAGNYDTQTYSGDISGPLQSGVLDGRASFYLSKTGGYINDTTLDHHVNGGTDEGGRITLLHKAEHTRATLYLWVNRIRSGVGANLLYTPEPPDDPAATTAFSLDIRDGTAPVYSQDLYSAVLNVEHDLPGAVTLTSVSSVFHSNEFALTDVDKGPFPILTGYQWFSRRVWSEELRLASGSGDHLGPGRITWLVGAFAQGNDPQVVWNNVQFTGDDFTDPTQTSDPGNFAGQITDAVQRHRDYALFANGTYAIGRLEFQAGLRGDYNWSSFGDPLWGLRATQHNLLAMPMASVSYHFTRQVMGYGTISRGFEPGDFAEGYDAAGVPVVNPYRAETTLNYELGLKSTLFDRVRLNTAIFYMDVANRLYQTNALEAGTIVGVVENIGASRNYGAEFDLTARLLPGLYVDANFGVTKAVWGAVPFLDTDLGAAAGVPGVGTNLDGRSVNFTPAYQGSLAVEWSHRIGESWAMQLRPSLALFGREYWDPTDHYYQPAYHLANLTLNIENERWTVAANVLNVFNKLYNTTFISAAELGAPFNAASVGRPRLWSATVTYRW
jgi:iron complex outermembrane receptor protein